MQNRHLREIDLWLC